MIRDSLEFRTELEKINKWWFTMLVEDIPKRAIYEDIATLFGIRNVKILEQVFAFITAHQSRLLSYETINDVVNLTAQLLLITWSFLSLPTW